MKKMKEGQLVRKLGPFRGGADPPPKKKKGLPPGEFAIIK